MFAKKAAPALRIRGFSRQLNNLYARRTAIDALIESLEDYDRCRTKRLAHERCNRTPGTLLRAV